MPQAVPLQPAAWSLPHQVQPQQMAVPQALRQASAADLAPQLPPQQRMVPPPLQPSMPLPQPGAPLQQTTLQLQMLMYQQHQQQQQQQRMQMGLLQVLLRARGPSPKDQGPIRKHPGALALLLDLGLGRLGHVKIGRDQGTNDIGETDRSSPRTLRPEVKRSVFNRQAPCCSECEMVDPAAAHWCAWHGVS